jgi:hypothetical protein
MSFLEHFIFAWNYAKSAVTVSPEVVWGHEDQAALALFLKTSAGTRLRGHFRNAVLSRNLAAVQVKDLQNLALRAGSAKGFCDAVMILDALASVSEPPPENDGLVDADDPRNRLQP